MPAPVTTWVTQTFPTAKSLNLALYTCDGTNDNPNGIWFHSYRPILFDSYGTAVTFHSASAGTQTSMSSPGPASTATTRCAVIYDTAGYFGQTADAPGGNGFYQFVPAVNGSAGDGVTRGGWTIISHFAPVKPTSTQVSVSADILQITTGTVATNGTRQPTNSSVDTCAYFLDLVNSGGSTWQPAITLRDSSAANTTNAVNLTDASGETPRFYSIWAAASSTTTGQVVFSSQGDYQWTAPAGVTQVTVQATAGGGGGGGGNQTGGGVTLGGGGGGGGEFGQGSVGVTAGNSYIAIVGAGGAGGAPGVNGAAGGISQFSGDTANVTVNGGHGGGSASTSVNGTGGAGGSGSSALVEFAGGAGATGKSASYGGGGGSSAGSRSVGNTATSGSGAPAPFGGGPGGAGGQQIITIVQNTHASITSTNSLTAKFPNPVQAGNTVLVFLYYQGNGPNNTTLPAEPQVTLSDGTAMNQRITGDVASNVCLQNSIWDISNVSGGQTGVNISCFGTGNSQKAILCQLYEVSGLGPNPQIDASTSHTQGPNNPTIFYQSSDGTPPANVPTAQAPDLWVAMTGFQYTANRTVFNPPKNQGWTTDTARYANNGGIFGGILTAHQTKTTTGNLLFSGTFNKGVSKGTMAVAYTSSAASSGVAPSNGPGGGGGAGLSNSGGGASGADGGITLSWTSTSGAAYGTPAVPAPFSNWSSTTTIGTLPTATVNINDNTGIRDVANFLSNPPIFRIATTAGGTVPPSTPATVTFSGTTPTVDNYGGWIGSTNTYVIPRTGIYLFHGLVCFSANSGSTRQAAVTINGTTYWGPASPAASTGETNSGKTQMFSLVAGDTVQLAARQNTASSLATSTVSQTRMLLIWLGEAGIPAQTWTPPDTTFRWISGTPGGQLPTLFQNHLANDLGFLCNRPYLLTYQTVATTFSPDVFNIMSMDTVQGLIHADVGDNYSGWSSGTANTYTAQVPGWYLMVGEFFTQGASIATATAVAGVQPSTSGGFSPAVSVDWFQQLLSVTGTGGGVPGGGATIFGLQYMNTGETITPVFMGHSYGGTFTTLQGSRNQGNFNSHFSLIWMSE